jgi:hypothetical protein
MNTPVSFEIAKLLKEKGFDKKTDSAYVDTTPFSENENDLVEYAFPQNHNEKEHRISAPTIAEVVMLLYDEHGVWIVVSTTISKQFIYKCIDMSGKKDPSKSNYPTCVSKDGTYYNSPTEAYLQAIKYTLKNLI